MSAARLPPSGDRHGFVLVGVVMFVLALTIIGLSLFSLSSYEAQFLQRSLDHEQAFQSAVGGLERAKVALAAPPFLLENVRANLPLENVVHAVAVQMGDSTGPVDWTPGNPILIRVTSRVGDGISRTAEGLFDPRLTRSYYGRAITASEGLAVDAFAAPYPLGATDRRWTIDVLGRVWEGRTPPDTNAWLPYLRTRPGLGIVTEPLPAPDLASYFAEHPAGAAAPVDFDPGTHTYTLNGGQHGPEYFRAPSGSTPDDFYYDTDALTPARARVHGLVVWEFPGGLRFDSQLTVEGPAGSNSCLVIVAGPAGPAAQPLPEHDPDAGIRCFAGLQVQDGISVILVSNGTVYVQHMNNPHDTDSWIGDIAIYARRVHLTGPERTPLPSPSMLLQHSPAGDIDNVYVDLLAGQNALPNSSGAGGRTLALRPGTWHVSDQ